jgi:formamidopyrimidine-DNA glycosylase
MPELPEVETIKRGLAKELVGHRVLTVDVREPKLFIGDPHLLTNQKIEDIERRAKILVWKLTDYYMIIHLKMTGQLIFVPNKNQKWLVGGHPDKAYVADLPHKHTHIIFHFDSGTLYYNDLRKFGWIRLLKNVEELKPYLAKLGTEYDWPEYTLDYFTQRLAKRKNITIKQALLEQTLVAGVGNIYADESLFCAKIRPTRKVAELKPKEVKKLFGCIPKIFELSLAHGGTSSQTYRKHDGSKGRYLEFANVYKRESLPCKVCGTPIERIKISGRSSHYCPNCQK